MATNADKTTSAAPAKKPALLSTGGSSSPDVHFLASKRAHLAGALAEGAAVEAEIAAIDEQLATLGYRAE